jgi:hypothetical protein
MAFVKTGDVTPIDSFLDDEKALVCDKCGRNKNALKLGTENEIVCECEFATEDEDERN